MNFLSLCRFLFKQNFTLQENILYDDFFYTSYIYTNLEQVLNTNLTLCIFFLKMHLDMYENKFAKDIIKKIWKKTNCNLILINIINIFG